MGEAMVFKSAGAWADQAYGALGRLLAKAPPGATDLAQLAQVDAKDFGLLIEGLLALAPVTGQRPDAELIELAGLRPVTEVLDLRGAWTT